LLSHKGALEKHLRARLGELFALDYDLLLYDVTSTYFEGLAATVLASMHASVPTSVLVLFVILLFNLLVGTRMSFRVLRAVLDYFAAPLRKVLVVGAGSIAESATREILRDGTRRSNPIGFLDDDVFKHRMLVRGLPVLGGVRDIDRIYRETGFDEILIAQNDTTNEDLIANQLICRSS
jgi:FlaA1/EpsC-like NDP-sugar epimerase